MNYKIYVHTYIHIHRFSKAAFWFYVPLRNTLASFMSDPIMLTGLYPRHSWGSPHQSGTDTCQFAVMKAPLHIA